MVRILIGVFFILHGLVHLLYFGLSRRLVQLETPIEGWPERSWIFSSFLGESATRSLASVLYVLATLVFVVSGLGFLFQADWGNPVIVGAAIFSSAIIILFWDGKLQQLPDKGFVGVLINVGVVAGLYLLDSLAIAL